ncbi:MAG TPA: hypothetical protein VKX17_18970 [Planctomycetota bacterium]|nr:hypothetical protein [Planctomycetota bacterium]
MKIQEFDLFFRDVNLGKVQTTDFDFPSYSGTFAASTKTDHPETRERIQKYIVYSREVEPMWLDEKRQDEAEEFTALHEEQFIDLIECSDWWLADSAGVRIPILIPVFGMDGINWRFDPERENSSPN